MLINRDNNEIAVFRLLQDPRMLEGVTMKD